MDGIERLRMGRNIVYTVEFDREDQDSQDPGHSFSNFFPSVTWSNTCIRL